MQRRGGRDKLAAMKKLATVFAATCALALATPVFACPHSDKAESDNAPRTAEKDNKKKDAAKAKEAEKPAAAENAKDNKTAKPTEKKPDKVSAR